MGLFNNRNLKKESADECLLEQWGKCIDMANGISDKRISTNGMFLTIESALVALITFSFDWKSLILSALGIGVGIYWFLSISAYKRMNTVKFEIINALEERLPAAPFREEWERLQIKKKNGKTKLFSLSKYEKILPIIFIVIYIACIILALVQGNNSGGSPC